jgi:hypothetical protein
MTSPLVYDLGTSNNGLLTATALQLLGNTSELASLANGSGVVSSVSGSAGVFNNVNTAGGIWGPVQLTLGAISTALTAGAVVSGWFLKSLDNGSTFEAYPPSVGPDFFIPLPASAITAGQKFPSWGDAKLPSVPFMVYVLNNATQAFAPTGNLLSIGPIAPAS